MTYFVYNYIRLYMLYIRNYIYIYIQGVR